MHKLEIIISFVSNFIWQLFLPMLVVFALFIGYKNLFIIKNKTTKKAKITFKQFVGPTSISLGAMIGTGAIIGVLGALNKYAANGQAHIEGMVLWTLIGCLIMLPLSYAETMLSKIEGKVPKDMISMLISKRAAAIYSVAFVMLYVFGFGGFQFSGISSIISLISNQYFHASMNIGQRYLFIIVPLITVTTIIVLTKKHEVFIKSMASMIGFGVLLYFIFFMMFLFNTKEYIPEFLSNVLIDFKNPVSIGFGLPFGIILAIQRITQTTESGIGGLPMAAHENDSKPRAAAVISIIPVVITVFVAIIITTYITSYGINIGQIQLPSGDYTRLKGLFNTIYITTGNFGLFALSVFALLSGASTLLGSYYYVKVLFDKNSENKNIFIYFVLLVFSGTLATFGFNIAFEIVDLLIFLVTGIFVITLFKFSLNKWKKHIINYEEDQKC